MKRFDPIITVVAFIFACIAFAGCSHLKSVTVETIDPKEAITSRKTTVSVTTFFDAKSDLSKFKNTTTGKTMGTSIGSVTQEASGSNVVTLVQAIAEGAAKGAASAMVGVPAIPAHP